MFLAWNEIKKNKLRFILIMGVLMLVAYLVFFLSGLAEGLRSMNRESVDKWEASSIVLTEESDKSLPQSNFTRTDLNKLDVDEQTVISVLSAIAVKGSDKKNVFYFGLEAKSFIKPNVIEGEEANGRYEVVASDALKEQGFDLGDEIELSSSDISLKIVGFTDKARFNAAPVLYGDIEDVNEIKYEKRTDEFINAIVVKGEEDYDLPKDFEKINIESFIEKLPGYSEQNLALTFMIGFLFVISTVIVAIFLYVLTVQKIGMFGIMKAQGISNGYLARSVIAQTFVLSFVGVAIGFGLALLTGLGLPAAVPVSFDISVMLVYGLVLVMTSIIGGVFSVLTIVRIDPLEAIGG